VVFVADRMTVQSAQRALLALNVRADEEEDLDPMYYQELIDSAPAGNVIHAAHGFAWWLRQDDHSCCFAWHT
jgi:hypothetical protein